MKIDLQKIPPEGLRIESEEKPEIVDIKAEGTEFNEPITISIFVSKAGDILLVNGSIKTNADLICSKCAKKYTQVLESKNFDFNRDVKGLKKIDITGDIREEMVILVPIKPLCKQGCKGLCPNCGQDLNEKQCDCKLKKKDIRWERLERFKIEEG